MISGKTLSSPSTLRQLQDAIQRSVVISSGWDVMDFLKQLQKLPAGNVAFATIPVLAEDGWSDDGSQSVVTVDPNQVKEWVAGPAAEPGPRARLRWWPTPPNRTTVEVANDSDINGLASAVADRLSPKGFTMGAIGNNEKTKVGESQVQAAKADDQGAALVAKELGGLPVVTDTSLPPGTVRVVLTEEYDGPGSGLDGTLPTATAATVDKASRMSPPSRCRCRRRSPRGRPTPRVN